MNDHKHSSTHMRLYGLTRQIRRELDEADTPGRQMSKRERKDLSHILSVLTSILRDDEDTKEMPVRHSGQFLNTQCEFFDLDANRIQCAIGGDLYHCSRKCVYATNVPGTMPPYCTKYMKGWIDR